MAPAWRQLFDSLERAVAPGLEEITASSEFRDVLAVVAKWNAAVNERTERASRRMLHSWNLPAASDVRRLRRQIADLDQEVAALRIALRAANEDRRVDRLAELATIDTDDATAANGASPTEAEHEESR